MQQIGLHTKENEEVIPEFPDVERIKKHFALIIHVVKKQINTLMSLPDLYFMIQPGGSKCFLEKKDW